MNKVCCYGTGVIGTAWGAVFLRGGCEVTFFDIGEEMLQNAKQTLEGIFAFYRSQNLMSPEECLEALQRTHYTMSVEEAVKDADFIQENCPESVELKQKVLAEIEKYCPETAIIASSTSGLLISEIAAHALHPERVVGGHPYNPVHVMPLVEISQCKKTDPEIAQKAKTFYQKMGKEPVVMNKECPGFICNRIQVAVAREAYDMVYRGVCSVEDMDKAIVYGVGLRWAILGQHLVSQLGGGAGGFRGINKHIGPQTKAWLKDLATWTELPEEYLDIAEKGIAEEMANRPEGTGRTMQELAAYLSGGILTILKYHNKL